MNNRKLCSDCHRVMNACICKLAASFNNTLPVTVLRHPSERKQEKATADLLRLSLTNCKIIDSEIFLPEEVLRPEHRNILIYPSENSTALTNKITTHSNSKIHIILIDGTWKKAYKIFMSNNFLHNLETLSLNVEKESIYKSIRKQKDNGLSTFEAAAEVLNLLENNFPLEDFDKALEGFLAQLKSFRN
ncbi:tRNA-uridine aminocarboxypropyltransferase [Halobacteriovorax sp. HLS]|uniref:tRNA-uridine aminocarboxypropyltransferase n=1 Tax=Halobacteriovorax sp. HLS TaxID=2234000 RepID=UPI000FDBEBFD|nr:tRNA-uridine aminocarboxypropyltransferase [Halobacteriovorax sp. HLS]